MSGGSSTRPRARRWRATIQTLCIALLALSLGGCALQSAMKQGHAHVARQEYRAALAAYQRAVAIDPDDDEAQRLRDQLTPYAVKEASTEARAEMAQGHYERAHALAFYVLKLDRDEGETLHGYNASLMHVGAEGLFRKGLVEPSYKLSARMVRLYPRHQAVLGLLEQARNHYFAESEKLAGKGDFDGALAAVGTVERYEPALKPEVDQRRAQLTGQWADRVAASAAQHEQAGRRGPAASLYARAYAIGHQPAHLEAMRRHVRELKKEGRFVLGVQADEATGDQARNLAVADLIRDKARSVEGLTLPTAGDDGVSMIATVGGAGQRCREETSLEQGAQDYVSGHREVPNPDHARLAQQVSQLQSRVDHSEQAVISARRQAADRRSEADRCDRNRVRPAQQKLERASAAAAAAQTKVEQLRERERRILERLDKLPPGPRSKARREQLQRRLDRVRAELRRARDKARRLRQQAQQAQQQHNAAAAQCATKLAAAEDALHKAQRLSDDRARDAEQLARAETDLAATPSHNTVDVIDTFRYPVKRVARSCSVQARLALQSAWANATSQQVLHGSGQTTDRAHPGYPRYGVVSDPLRFAHSDAELVAFADADAADEAVRAIGERARAYYAHMTEKALDMAHHDAHAATDVMLAMLLAAPTQLSDEHKAALARHLQHHYQLSDWRALTQ